MAIISVKSEKVKSPENINQFCVRYSERCQLCDHIAASRNFCLKGKSPEGCPGPVILTELQPFIAKYLERLEELEEPGGPIQPCVNPYQTQCLRPRRADCLACVRRQAEVELCCPKGKTRGH